MNNTILQFPISCQPTMTDEGAISEMMIGLEKLIEIGALKGLLDEILKDYEIDLSGGCIKAHLIPESVYDTSKLTTLSNSNILEIPKGLFSQTGLLTSEKVFSAATIQERMRLAKMNRKVHFRYMIMDYKRYYNSKKKVFEKDPEKFRHLKNMFLTDLTGMMTEILPHIEEGKQLNSLIGVSQVNPKMTKIAKDLSLNYKRILKSEKTSGQLSKGAYQKLKTSYQEFMDQLVETVFPGSSEFQIPEDDKEVEINPIQQQIVKATSDTRKYSYCEDGRVKLFPEKKKRIKFY